VSIGESIGYGLPELVHFSSDAALCGPDASLPRLVLTFPASSVAEILAKATAPVPLTGACGALVRNHLTLLSTILPSARKGDIPIIAEATAALLSTCLARGEGPDAQGKVADPSLLRAEVERVIRRNISSARLCPERICALVGLSRSALYRLLCEDGGVARKIRSLRLEMIREDLADPSLADKSIGEIARLRGLHCVSSFNRSFRQTFSRSRTRS
jgi:AraC-like DNA-binding protein